MHTIRIASTRDNETDLVLIISTGMEEAVVARPLIMLATKWQPMLSLKYPNVEINSKISCNNRYTFYLLKYNIHHSENFLKVSQYNKE